MRKQLTFNPFSWLILCAILPTASLLEAQTCWDCLIRETIDRHAKMGERYKAGDTNLPVIQIDTFYSLCGRSLSKDRKVFYGCYNGISNWGNHGNESISQTNFTRILVCINQLPTPSSKVIATNRQVHVSCERSNKWVHFVYDLDDPPNELTRIHELMHVPFYGAKNMKPVTWPYKDDP